MTAFLGSDAAQATFIAQALALMADRKADGANLDFEPMSAAMTPAYLSFVAKLRAAMQARFPGSTLVNSTSAGAGAALVAGLVPLVDKQMVMTYGYRTATATVAGAMAPLAHAARNVDIHITRILQSAPADSILLGVPYYGFDWPVTSAVPNATVQTTRRPTARPRASRMPRRGSISPPTRRSCATTTPSRAARTTSTATR